jgi:hypothetical protein
MNWIDKRAEFQNRYDELSQENIQGLVTQINTAIGNYIASGGISQDSNNNTKYNTIINLTSQLKTIKDKYSTLNNEIISYLSTHARDNNLGGILTENGKLQSQINELEKIEKQINIDVDSAVARDELLRSRNTDISSHKLFLLDKPVRKSLIPYLWILSILFIGVGLIIFRIYAPSLGMNTAVNTDIPLMVIEFLTNKYVLSSLLMASLIVILFLSLKIGGVI